MKLKNDMHRELPVLSVPELGNCVVTPDAQLKISESQTAKLLVSSERPAIVHQSKANLLLLSFFCCLRILCFEWNSHFFLFVNFCLTDASRIEP